MSDSCIFCRIVRGEIPSTRVYEDEAVLAFKDINPAAPVHILVIPKQHVADLMSLDAKDGSLLSRMVQAAQQVARNQGVEVSGFRLLTNNGPDSGQVVHHLHFHLIGGRKLGPLA